MNIIIENRRDFLKKSSLIGLAGIDMLLTDLAARLKAPRKNPHQPLFVSDPLKQTGRVMVKDEDLCVHCGLCAERCPTAAWDMQKSTINLPHANDHQWPTPQRLKTA